jgi:hypothetical protein
VDELACRAAAAWWVAAIRKVRAERAAIEPEMTKAAVMCALAEVAMRADGILRNLATEGRLARFGAELDRRLRDTDPGEWGATLSVDYHPEELLAEAAEAAGIDASQFPRKTRMRVYDDHVTAKAGYGSRHRLIWSSAEYGNPDCEDQEWDDEGPNGPLCKQAKWHDGRHDWEA